MAAAYRSRWGVMEGNGVLEQLFTHMDESECRHYMLKSMLQVHNPLQILVIGHRKSAVERPVYDSSRLIRYVLFGYPQLNDDLVLATCHGERLPGIVDAQWLPGSQLASPMMIIYQISGRTKVETDEGYVDQIKLFLDSRTIDLIWYVLGPDSYRWTREDSDVTDKLGTMLKNNYSEIPVMLLREKDGVPVNVFVHNYELDSVQCQLKVPRRVLPLFTAMSRFLRTEGRMREWLAWMVSTAKLDYFSLLSKFNDAARLIADVVLGSQKAVSERTAASSKALFCHCTLQQLLATFHKMFAFYHFSDDDPTPDESFVSPPFLRLLSKAAPGSVSKILLLYSVYTLGFALHYLAQQANNVLAGSGPKPAQDFSISAIWRDYGKSRAAKRDWDFGCDLLRRHSFDDEEHIASLISGHFFCTEEVYVIQRGFYFGILRVHQEVYATRHIFYLTYYLALQNAYQEGELQRGQWSLLKQAARRLSYTTHLLLLHQFLFSLDPTKDILVVGTMVSGESKQEQVVELVFSSASAMAKCVGVGLPSSKVIVCVPEAKVEVHSISMQSWESAWIQATYDASQRPAVVVRYIDETRDTKLGRCNAARLKKLDIGGLYHMSINDDTGTESDKESDEGSDEEKACFAVISLAKFVMEVLCDQTSSTDKSKDWWSGEVTGDELPGASEDGGGGPNSDNIGGGGGGGGGREEKTGTKGEGGGGGGGEEKRGTEAPEGGAGGGVEGGGRGDCGDGGGGGGGGGGGDDDDGKIISNRSRKTYTVRVYPGPGGVFDNSLYAGYCSSIKPTVFFRFNIRSSPNNSLSTFSITSSTGFSVPSEPSGINGADRCPFWHHNRLAVSIGFQAESTELRKDEMLNEQEVKDVSLSWNVASSTTDTTQSTGRLAVTVGIPGHVNLTAQGDRGKTKSNGKSHSNQIDSKRSYSTICNGFAYRRCTEYSKELRYKLDYPFEELDTEDEGTRNFLQKKGICSATDVKVKGIWMPLRNEEDCPYDYAAERSFFKELTEGRKLTELDPKLKDKPSATSRLIRSLGKRSKKGSKGANDDVNHEENQLIVQQAPLCQTYKIRFYINHAMTHLRGQDDHHTLTRENMTLENIMRMVFANTSP